MPTVHQPTSPSNVVRLDAITDMVSIIGLGGYHLGKPKTVVRVRTDHSCRHRRRRQLSRQRLGIPRRRERKADGPRDRRPPRLGVCDDQGVHAWTQCERWPCASSTNRCAACAPTISTSGRFTNVSTTTIPNAISRAGGVVEALDRAKREGKVRYVGFTGHKDPEILLKMLVVRLSLRRLPAAAERLRRALPQLSEASPAQIGAAQHCCDRHEEPGRRRTGHREEDEPRSPMRCGMR